MSPELFLILNWKNNEKKSASVSENTQTRGFTFLFNVSVKRLADVIGNSLHFSWISNEQLVVPPSCVINCNYSQITAVKSQIMIKYL